ncbi:V-set domain-containing T-cell activation inhibitor 1 [Liparis tanakae]|uniref:V-set domain-containing T-cell activation inhibitor 1 n=1 Tax=Liparis tanakae TaxID=230148 RepID=A0A4Z2E410_9TELE|nr:V-set domain-containing T-cell activation inhibitor 1 [Liparis tanakae]
MFESLGDASGDGPVAIRTWVGEAVILPCRINVSRRQDVPSVEWSKRGLTPNVCFLYRAGCETFEEKNPVFLFRTGLFLEELKNGNASLRLSDVRLTDAGIYECRRLQGAPRVVSIVELFVGTSENTHTFFLKSLRRWVSIHNDRPSCSFVTIKRI